MSHNSGKSSSTHFLPPDKIQKVATCKIDGETIKGIQSFAEKMVQDIITRSALIAQHGDSDIVDSPEVCIVVDKNFDNTFGIKTATPEKNSPLDKHIEKMAEITKNR